MVIPFFITQKHLLFSCRHNSKLLMKIPLMIHPLFQIKIGKVELIPVGQSELVTMVDWSSMLAMEAIAVTLTDQVVR